MYDFDRATAKTPLTFFLCQSTSIGLGRRFSSRGSHKHLAAFGWDSAQTLALAFIDRIGLQSIQLNRHIFSLLYTAIPPCNRELGRKEKEQMGGMVDNGVFAQYNGYMGGV